MQINELIRKAQTIVDCDGNKRAVQLDYTTWEELLELLEDIEDMEEMERIRESGGKYVLWEQAKIKLRANGIDVRDSNRTSRDEGHVQASTALHSLGKPAY